MAINPSIPLSAIGQMRNDNQQYLSKYQNPMDAFNRTNAFMGQQNLAEGFRDRDPSMSTPDFQKQQLSTLGSYNPESAMNILYNQGRGKGGVTGNALLKQQNAQAAFEVATKMNELASQGLQLLKEDPSANVNDINEQINVLQAEYGQYTGQKQYDHPLQKAFKRQLEVTGEERKVSDDERKSLESTNRIRDYVLSAYTTLNLKEPVNALRAMMRVHKLYPDAVSLKSQSGQQQFLTNMIKMSDASQVLLSEADANRSQSLVDKALGLVQKLKLGTAIAVPDIKNIYRTATQLNKAAITTADRVIGSIAEEVTKRGVDMDKAEVKNILGVIYPSTFDIPLQQGGFGQVGEQEDKAAPIFKTRKPSKGSSVEVW